MYPTNARVVKPMARPAGASARRNMIGCEVRPRRPPASYPPSMHTTTLRALEFDQIAAVVRSYAVTPLGARQLDRLVPSTEPVRVAEGLDLTGEAVLLLQDHQSLPLRA